MKTEGLSTDAALDSVRQARSCADPNSGFKAAAAVVGGHGVRDQGVRLCLCAS